MQRGDDVLSFARRFASSCGDVEYKTKLFYCYMTLFIYIYNMSFHGSRIVMDGREQYSESADGQRDGAWDEILVLVNIYYFSVCFSDFFDVVFNFCAQEGIYFLVAKRKQGNVRKRREILKFV